jgi:hypothetical protein
MNSDLLSSFQPYEFSPETETLLELQGEIRRKSAEIFSLYFDSMAGYDMLTRHLSEWQVEQADKMKKLGIAVDEDTWATLDQLLVDPPPHGKISRLGGFAQTLADYRDRLLPSGRNAHLIGNYLLIALYQHWEDSWRGRIARALKLEDKNTIMSDYWGDLRLIRICLIHKKGIADKDVATKSILFQWFKEGDTIVLDRDRIEAIIVGLFQFLYTELIAFEKKKSSSDKS